MSYLDLPRLHFSGLFFTGPSTINNVIQNYTPNVPLKNAQGQYLPNAVWNPLGVAQWWLEECTVLSAVGPNATPVSSSDPVIGAAVESPSPKTPMSDGQGGFYDIAKMVDLDPDQQGRSALYGVRIGISLPNGAGLQGSLTVPELRQLRPRVPAGGGSWTAVGNWMGTLQNVQWSGDISGSQFLTALKTASAKGLAVKLTVDLHQNNPANVFTSGDMFCYGRVLGSIAPAFAGELAQVVPGRYLSTFSGPTPSAAAETVEPAPQLIPPRVAVAKQAAAIGTSRIAAVDTGVTTPPDPWNPAFAVIRQSGSQTLLSIDIGGSILLNVGGTPNNPTADGTFEVDTGIKLGVFNLTSQQFVPFSSGALSFVAPDQYQPLPSTQKTCVLVKNSGVFTIPLTPAEVNLAKANPLSIQVDGTTVAQEFNSGLWMDVSVSSERLECGSGQKIPNQIMVRKFGAPIVGTQPPVTSLIQLVQWILQDGSWGNPSPLPTSTDIGISFGKTDANGLASITTTAKVPDITLPAIRQPLDSQIYYVSLTDPQGNAIGDATPPNLFQSPTISVLLWKVFHAPANPTWSDIGAIFSAYARLYPGMKSRLDISDEQTVLGFAPAILARMRASISDAAYMPVTRDLSPSKMKMIVSWLTQVSQQ